jgi:hypothetical protein
MMVTKAIFLWLEILVVKWIFGDRNCRLHAQEANLWKENEKIKLIMGKEDTGFLREILFSYEWIMKVKPEAAKLKGMINREKK